MSLENTDKMLDVQTRLAVLEEKVRKLDIIVQLMELESDRADEYEAEQRERAE